MCTVGRLRPEYAVRRAARRGGLSRCTLSDTVPLAETALRGGDLTGANLEHVDLSGADLRDADLAGATVRDSDLTGAILYRTDLTEVYLGRADLTRATLQEGTLVGANFGHAGLTGSNLQGADLTGVTLESGDLTDADLRNADLSDADLRNATLSGSDLRGSIIQNVVVNQGTRSGTQTRAEQAADDAEAWDAIVQAYNDLKNAFGEAGLIGKTRQHHVLEQRARGLEAKAKGSTLFGNVAEPNHVH